MTTYALGTGATWPFVTLPRFEAQGSLARNQSNAGYIIALQPLVTQENLIAWENYSIAHQGWVQESLDYLGLHEKASQISPVVVKDIVTSPQLDQSQHPYYAPVWQCSPVNTNQDLINYNAFGFSYFDRVFQRMVDTRKAALSEVINLVPHDPNWPQSFMAAPVYGDIYDNSPLVGVLTAVLPWHNNFLNLVPEGIDGMQIVVRNTCDQDFTYQVNGPKVEFLGIGDLHDPKYDHLEVTAGYDAFTSTKECVYTLHVFPSDEFRSEYISNMPKVYTGAVTVIFVLTALVFIMYDCLVERRQYKVMTSAVRTNAIVVRTKGNFILPALYFAAVDRFLFPHVPSRLTRSLWFMPKQNENNKQQKSSLFPASVRDRLIENAAGEKSTRDVAGSKKEFRGGTTLFSPSVINSLKATEGEGGKSEAEFDGKPIADLFPHTTVMFADIAGFTAWSSVREPTQVFILLESIFRSFDAIARRLRIFKVSVFLIRRMDRLYTSFTAILISFFLTHSKIL